MKDLMPDADGQYNLGGDGRRWATLVVDRIICNNISGAGVTISGAAQVDHGITMDPATHKPQIEDNITGAQTFEGAIIAQSTLGVTGLITASGGISGTTATFSGIIDANKVGDYSLDAAGNVRIVGELDVNAQINANNAGDYSLDAAGNARIVGELDVNAQINANKAGDFSLDAAGNVNIDGDLDVGGTLAGAAATFSSTVTATGNVRTNAKFNVSGTDGQSIIIDLDTSIAQLTFAGGILTNVFVP